MRAGPALCQVALKLLANKRLLDLAEDGLGVAEGEADVLHLVTSTVSGVKWHGEGARRGALNANLNDGSHGTHLSCDGAANAASLRFTARRSKRSGW